MYAASILFVTFLTVLIQPEYALANATNGTEILEEPKTLPLKDEKVINEIWQEDVHEVVVRKQRGTKEISGASTGKKKEKNHFRTTKIPKTISKTEQTKSDFNSESFSTQSSAPNGKHHQKHKKINHLKKHTNSSGLITTLKPIKESKYYYFIILLRFILLSQIF